VLEELVHRRGLVVERIIRTVFADPAPYASANQPFPIPIPIPTEPWRRRLQLLQAGQPGLAVGGVQLFRGPGGAGASPTDHQRWRCLRSWLEAELDRGAIASRRAALARCRWPCGSMARRGAVSKIGCQRASAQAELTISMAAAGPAQSRRSCGPSAPDGTVACCSWSLNWGLGRTQLTRPRLAWCAAWAWAGLVLELGQLELLEAYLYSWGGQPGDAAVRLIPLDPTRASAFSSP